MATSKDFKEFIMDKFAGMDSVTVRPMMGEYVLHVNNRVLGFLADEQLLLEPGPNISKLLPEAEYRELFPGSKLFVIIDDDISPRKLRAITETIYEDLPLKKPRKPRKPSKPLK